MNILEAHNTNNPSYLPIGRISAASTWHGAGSVCASGDWKDAALSALKRCAEDVDADAIINVAFEVDGVSYNDMGEIVLQRICASGMAVRFAAMAA